jgi:outer membrane protein assembly factor BamB
MAPAIAADGTIYTAAAQHFANRYSYLIAVNKNLTPKWSASLRNLFTDGCGVPITAGGTLPPNGAQFGCREGAPLGVDPQTRRPGDGRVTDSGSSTPLVAPDGTIFLGTFTAYNGFRGHTVRFSKEGQYLGNYDFGWDITPAVHQHDKTYSLIVKDNHYADYGPDSPRDFYITQLSPNLQVEWKFKATNTDHCHRDASGNVVCEPGDTGTFEWCMNAPAVDKNGTAYAISEDGWLYAVDQGGTLRDRVFLELALGAAYTPASLGRDGRIYAQNAGHMFVAGK